MVAQDQLNLEPTNIGRRRPLFGLVDHESFPAYAITGPLTHSIEGPVAFAPGAPTDLVDHNCLVFSGSPANSHLEIGNESM